MKYLALDLGTKCGWAHGPPVDFGTWRLKRARESIGRAGTRLRRHLDDVRPSYAGYEKIDFAANTYAAQFYGGLKMTLLGWCEENGVRCHGFSPQKVKLRATGRGNANKLAVMRAAQLATGKAPADDNAADAFWLLVLLVEKVTGERLG